MFKSIINSGLIILSLICFSCSNNELPNTQEEINTEDTRLVTIKLTDDPTDLDEINIDFKALILGTGDRLDFDINLNLDLLDYQEGRTVTLLEAQVLQNELQNLSFVLGDNHTVVQDGESFPLILPEGHVYKLDLEINDPSAQEDLSLVIDFDASKSVFQLNSGDWILDPTLKIVSVNDDPIEVAVASLPADKVEDLEAEYGSIEVLEVTNKTYCFDDRELVYIKFSEVTTDILHEGIYDMDCQLQYKINRHDYLSTDYAVQIIQQAFDQPVDFYREIIAYRSQTRIVYSAEILKSEDKEFVRMYFSDEQGKICED